MEEKNDISRYYDKAIILILMYILTIIIFQTNNISDIISEYKIKDIKANIKNEMLEYKLKNYENNMIAFDNNNNCNTRIDKNIIKKYIKNVNLKISEVMSDIISKAIIKASEKTGIPIGLIIGVISVESHFDPQATSSANACGIMQIHRVHNGTLIKTRNIKTGEKIVLYVNPEKIYDPTHNILVGSYLLAKFMNDCNCLHNALIKYVGSKNSGTKYPAKIYKFFSEFQIFQVTGGKFDFNDPPKNTTKKNNKK